MRYYYDKILYGINQNNISDAECSVAKGLSVLIIEKNQCVDYNFATELLKIDKKMLQCLLGAVVISRKSFGKILTLEVQVYGSRIRVSTAADNNISSPIIEDENIEICDLIVAGTGTAGALCAIESARRGMKVISIEMLKEPGGTPTEGCITSYYCGTPGGKYKEIDEYALRLEKEGKFPKSKKNGIGTGSHIAAIRYFLAQSNVDTRYECTVISVICNDKHVSGIKYIDANGIIHTVKASFVADCTGDGIVAMMAGCEMLGGRDFDGNYHMFSNAVEIMLNGEIHYGQHDDGLCDQYNPKAFSDAALYSCADSMHNPDDERFNQNKKLTRQATLLGLREGKRIVGEETITLIDFLNGKHTDKPIFYEWSHLDNHGRDTAFESEAVRDMYAIAGLWHKRFAIPIPMGALIPKDIKGLLVAGRAIAVDHDMAIAVRMKDAMQKSGEAAAAMIYLALKNKCDVRNVDYSELYALLRETNVISKPDTFDAPRYVMFDGIKIIKVDDMDMSEHSYGKFIKNGKFDRESIIRGIGDTSGECSESTLRRRLSYAITAMELSSRLKLEAAIEPLLNILRYPERLHGIPFDPAHDVAQCDEDNVTLYTIYAAVALKELCASYPEYKAEVCEQISERINRSQLTLTMTKSKSRLDTSPMLEGVASSLSAAFAYEKNNKKGTETERRYIIKYPDIELLKQINNASICDIYQTYLVPKNGVSNRRVRKTVCDNNTVKYTYTEKLPKEGTLYTDYENEIAIDKFQYERLLKESDICMCTISKTRITIPFNEYFAEIDIYPYTDKYAICEVETNEENTDKPIVLPDYLTVLEEITGNKNLSNRALAMECGYVSLADFVCL